MTLKICLHIEEVIFLEVFQELLPQAGISIEGDENASDGLLCTSPKLNSTRPSLNFLSLLRPMRFRDLLSLLENLPYSQEITFSHFSLDLREKILKNLKTQQEQRLTEKEYQLLRFLYHNKGKEISKDTLLKEIWEYHPQAETHTLETHIYRLRQKLEDDPNLPQVLLNGKEGYWIK